jgi:hypothetical protein
VKLALLLCLAACGGGPSLTNLRCRDPAHCQDAEDPLKLLLAVDFRDDSGTLGEGVLNLRVGGNTQQTISIADLFSAQKIAPGSRSGTLQIDDDIFLDRMSKGMSVQVSAVAVNGQGSQSNEPSLAFALRLGAGDSGVASRGAPDAASNGGP